MEGYCESGNGPPGFIIGEKLLASQKGLCGMEFASLTLRSHLQFHSVGLCILYDSGNEYRSFL